MENIAVFGAGGFGREVEMLIHQINNQKPSYNFIGYFDDGITINTNVNNQKVLGGINELNDWPDNLSLVIAIGDPVTKKKIINAITNNHIQYPTLIHPGVLIGDKSYVEIGRGCIICAGTIITVNIKIGEFVILNLACTVGHDAVINDYTSIMPSVNVSGEVTIGTEVFIGTGVQIVNRKSIGNNSIIGAGGVVVKDIPENCTAVGSPAVPIKFHNR